MKQHYKREWLNPKGGRAYMICRASASDGYAGGTLTLADCHGEITLDFETYTQDKVQERLHKIDRIRAALDVLEDKLIEGYMVMPSKKEQEEISRLRHLERKRDEQDELHELLDSI